MIIYALLLCFVFAILKWIEDLISFRDKFKEWGFPKFFWRETRDEEKKDLFYYWFPMFYDAWHLVNFLQIVLFSFLITSNVWFILLYTVVISILFSILYETTKNT